MELGSSITEDMHCFREKKLSSLTSVYQLSRVGRTLILVRSLSETTRRGIENIMGERIGASQYHSIYYDYMSQIVTH